MRRLTFLLVKRSDFSGNQSLVTSTPTSKTIFQTHSKARTVEVLFLESGQYRLVGRWQLGEKARSRLLKGLTVEVDQIFGKSE